MMSTGYIYCSPQLDKNNIETKGNPEKVKAQRGFDQVKFAERERLKKNTT